MILVLFARKLTCHLRLLMKEQWSRGLQRGIIMQIKRQGVPYEIKGPSAARLAIRSKNGKPYACHEGTRETSHTMSIVMWVAIAHPASKGDTPCTIPIS